MPGFDQFGSQWLADGRPTIATGHYDSGYGMFGGHVDWIPDIDLKYYIGGDRKNGLIQAGAAPVSPPPYINAPPGPTPPVPPPAPLLPPVLDGTSATWGRTIDESFGTRKITGLYIWVSAARGGDALPTLSPSLVSPGGGAPLEWSLLGGVLEFVRSGDPQPSGGAFWSTPYKYGWF